MAIFWKILTIAIVVTLWAGVMLLIVSKREYLGVLTDKEREYMFHSVVDDLSRRYTEQRMSAYDQQVQIKQVLEEMGFTPLNKIHEAVITNIVDEETYAYESRMEYERNKD